MERTPEREREGDVIGSPAVPASRPDASARPYNITGLKFRDEKREARLRRAEKGRSSTIKS